MQDQDQRIEPVDVEVHVDRRLMQVRWSDGHDAVYDFEFLRWQCPCAECRGEGGVPGVLAQTTALRPEQTEMTDLRVVGRYGLTPVWADGHQTGIYTYRALRAMCQCAACAGAKAGGGASAG
ncbi:MAG TPA: DUF971 domain-containing protein [Chloroflexota bacterium]|nr:DUF971 domain-containing protein [Chloroflexota bacterium]